MTVDAIKSDMLTKLTEMKKNSMRDKMKSEDPIRKRDGGIECAILSILQTSVNTLAKEGNREITDNDILVSAKKLIKQNSQTRNEMKNGTAEAYVVLDHELFVLNMFLPSQMTEAEIIEFIDGIINAIPVEERTRKNQGAVMAKIKEKSSVMDMSFAGKYASSKFS